MKYNPDGIQQWETSYDGPGNDLDAATALTVDNIGNVYVTGYSKGMDTGSDYATLKFDSKTSLGVTADLKHYARK